MKRSEALVYAASKLEPVIADSVTRRQEAETLLQHCLGITRLQLYIDPHFELSPDEEKRLNNLINRRFNLEPVSYILGHREFFGLEFIIESSVLIPRPESELLVEKVIEHVQTRYRSLEAPLLIADAGTGSGCLSIALATHLKKCRFIGIDISREALNIARRNILKHNLSGWIELLQGDLLSALKVSGLDIVIANLPYIPSEEYQKLSEDMLKYEPVVALDGGTDGLFCIKGILAQLSKEIRKPSCIFLEVGIVQAPAVKEVVKEFPAGTVIEIFKDLGGVNRLVKISFS